MLAYSVDDKGSEYYTIYLRNIEDNKIIEKPIKETSGELHGLMMINPFLL